MVWLKSRNQSGGPWHSLVDTARGAGKSLATNTTAAQETYDSVASFSSSGFGIGNTVQNTSPYTYASWTFRKAPKFFDVVTYTGNGTSGRTISHSLGTTPGMIIVKCTTTSTLWAVWHRSLTAGQWVQLDQTGAAATNNSVWTTTQPTSTVFSVGDNGATNGSGDTYVAYLFAHDTTSDGIVQCGSFTTDGSGVASVNLGWEPQWLLAKSATHDQDWDIVDTMRGWVNGASISTGDDPTLSPTYNFAEQTGSARGYPTATGFDFRRSASQTYIYIAIRRGPMRTPTSGTSVFSPASQVGGGTLTTNFPSDMTFGKSTGITEQWYLLDRLRGSRTNSSVYLSTNNTNSETTSSGYGLGYDRMTTVKDSFFGSAYNYSFLNFRRAPSFFDVVCYTGTGVARTVNHNLGVAPELMIVKDRSAVNSWTVYCSALGNTSYLFLNGGSSAQGPSSTRWNSTTPNATTFSVGTDSGVNWSGDTYVAYLFASCPGVSKVGSYTGNGSSQTINCGFAAGARFVMIKRTDSTGSWWVWDVARGLVSGNDPALQLNSTAAETTGIDSIDPDSSGFIVNQDTTTNINVSSGTYVYLAIS